MADGPASGDVLSPFLRAKHAWEQGDTGEAMRILNTLLDPDGDGPAFWMPSTTIEAAAQGIFESVVVQVLSTDDYLLVPFGEAISTLWNALPGQYVLRALDLRNSAASDRDEGAIDVVYRAAADGLLSDRHEDYNRLALVVLRPEDHPKLAERVDWHKLEALLRDAVARRSREAFAHVHPDLLANILLYHVFYRMRPVYPDVVLDSLNRSAELDAELLAMAGERLTEWSDRPDAQEISRVGLRKADGCRACLKKLAQAIADRAFDEFVDTCVRG